MFMQVVKGKYVDVGRQKQIGRGGQVSIGSQTYKLELQIDMVIENNKKKEKIKILKNNKNAERQVA